MIVGHEDSSNVEDVMDSSSVSETVSCTKEV